MKNLNAGWICYFIYEDVTEDYYDKNATHISKFVAWTTKILINLKI